MRSKIIFLRLNKKSSNDRKRSLQYSRLISFAAGSGGNPRRGKGNKASALEVIGGNADFWALVKEEVPLFHLKNRSTQRFHFLSFVGNVKRVA